MIDSLLAKLAQLAEIEFADVVMGYAKHEVWKSIKTFPNHFHEGIDNNVHESLLPEIPDQALRYILIYVREVLYKNKFGENQDDLPFPRL